MSRTPWNLLQWIIIVSKAIMRSSAVLWYEILRKRGSFGYPRVFQVWEKAGNYHPAWKGTLDTRERVHIVVSEGHRVTAVGKWEKES